MPPIPFLVRATSLRADSVPLPTRGPAPWRAAAKFSLLAPFTVLGACGGGGGGGGVSPATVTLRVVVTGDGSVASSPAGILCSGDCSAEFAVATPITLTATPAAGAIFAGWTGGATSSESSTTFALTASTTITVAFAPEPAPGWTDVRTVTSPSAQEVRAVLDAAGRATVVWHGFSSASDPLLSVFASRSIVGGAWSPPVEIDAQATEYAVDPQIAVDQATGRVMALWLTAGGELWGRAFAPETGWGGAQRIDGKGTHQGAALRNHRVGVDGIGEAVAVWEKNDPLNTFSIWSSRFELGSGWTAPAVIEDNVDFPWDQDAIPQLAVLGSGNAVAVWRSLGANRLGYWTNTFQPSSGFGTATDLVRDGPGVTGFRPALVGDGQGNVVLAWNELEFLPPQQRLSTVYARRFVGGSWQTGRQQLGPGVAVTANVHAEPALGLAPAGHAVLAWALEDRAVRAAVAAPGGSFGSVQTVKPTSANLEADLVTAAADDLGRGFVAWVQWRPNLDDPQVWISRLEPGAGFGAPVQHQPNTLLASQLNLAMNGSGQALVVWNQLGQIASRFFVPGP